MDGVARVLAVFSCREQTGDCLSLQRRGRQSKDTCFQLHGSFSTALQYAKDRTRQKRPHFSGLDSKDSGTWHLTPEQVLLTQLHVQLKDQGVTDTGAAAASAQQDQTLDEKRDE